MRADFGGEWSAWRGNQSQSDRSGCVFDEDERMSPYDLFVCRATIKAWSATSQGHRGVRKIRSRAL